MGDQREPTRGGALLILLGSLICFIVFWAFIHIGPAALTAEASGLLSGYQGAVHAMSRPRDTGR